MIHGPGEVLQTRQHRDQATTERGRGLHLLGGAQLQARRKEIPQTRVIVLPRIGIGHGGHILRLEGLLRQQRIEEAAGPRVIARVGGHARGLQGERIAVCRLRSLRGLRQNIDRALGIAVAPREIHRRPHHAQHGRIVPIQVVDNALRRGGILAALVEMQQRDLRLHTLHRVCG